MTLSFIVNPFGIGSILMAFYVGILIYWAASYRKNDFLCYGLIKNSMVHKYKYENKFFKFLLKYSLIKIALIPLFMISAWVLLLYVVGNIIYFKDDFVRLYINNKDFEFLVISTLLLCIIIILSSIPIIVKQAKIIISLKKVWKITATKYNQTLDFSSYKKDVDFVNSITQDKILKICISLPKKLSFNEHSNPGWIKMNDEWVTLALRTLSFKKYEIALYLFLFASFNQTNSISNQALSFDEKALIWVNRKEIFERIMSELILKSRLIKY